MSYKKSTKLSCDVNERNLVNFFRRKIIESSAEIRLPE